ncbi:MAG: hypothetical protein RIM99_18670 [Cyclobacteriaceae bacterium]
MEKELTLKEKGKKKLAEWKQFAEELNVQLHLGVADTKEEFEVQKKNLLKVLNAFSERLEDARDISKKSVLKVKTSLQDLRVQAALGKAETEEQLKEQQKKLAHGIHDLKHKISSAYESTKEGAEHFFEEVSDQLEDYHTRFDLLRLQVHLGKEEAKEEWEERKHTLTHKLAVIKARLHGAEENAEEKWNDFSTEIKSAWRHFKRAFKNPD